MQNDIDKTKKRALRILGKRTYSESEMLKRLTDKGETAEAAEETVRWLVELGYIDDDNYATLIVNHYAAKGYGEARIRAELNKRGIPRSMWDEKLSLLSTDEQTDSAGRLLAKKLRGSTDKDDIRKAKEALVRRGFSYDEAQRAVNRYLEELGVRN